MKKIKAKWFHQGRLRKVRLVVIHSMESQEKGDTAESVAAWFARGAAKTSAHICFDNNSAVRCVDDSDTAWAAPNANADGLHAELAGRARQTRAEWLDDFGKAMLKLVAKQVAAWCKKYNIPVVHLTPKQVAAGKKGICSHADVTEAYPGTGSHWDPGKDFPWDVFLPLVKKELDTLNGDTEKPATPPKFPGRTLVYVEGKPYMTGGDVKTWQARQVELGYPLDVDGRYGPESAKATRALQDAVELLVTGAVDKDTWAAAWKKAADATL